MMTRYVFCDINLYETKIVFHYGFSNLTQIDHIHQKRVRTLSRKAREMLRQHEEPKQRLPRLLPSIVSGETTIIGPNSRHDLEVGAMTSRAQCVFAVYTESGECRTIPNIEKRKKESLCSIQSVRQLKQGQRRLLEKVSTV
jgi:hypothetical protein